jgi:hypothetical protein
MAEIATRRTLSPPQAVARPGPLKQPLMFSSYPLLCPNDFDLAGRLQPLPSDRPSSPRRVCLHIQVSLRLMVLARCMCRIGPGRAWGEEQAQIGSFEPSSGIRLVRKL